MIGNLSINYNFIKYLMELNILYIDSNAYTIIYTEMRLFQNKFKR